MSPAIRPLPPPTSRLPPPHTHPGGTPTPHVCKLDITRHLLCNKWRHKWRGWKANERVGLGRRMKRSLDDSVWKEAPLQDPCPQSIAAHRPTEQCLYLSLFFFFLSLFSPLFLPKPVYVCAACCRCASSVSAVTFTVLYGGAVLTPAFRTQNWY